MPTKAELYAQMAEKVATQLTGSWQEWAGFLTTAARLYKYPFHEQLMIYAQRPDATACAEYDFPGLYPSGNFHRAVRQAIIRRVAQEIGRASCRERV